LPGNPSLRRALRALAAREESGKGRFVFLRLEFVEKELEKKSKYDLVITDPPSFAPNEKSVPQATAAYIKIFSNSIRLVEDNGLFAASSCSSHISTEAFLEITREAFSKARKRGTLIYMGSQPVDHPYPLQMTELRYLKFALFRVEA